MEVWGASTIRLYPKLEQQVPPRQVGKDDKGSRVKCMGSCVKERRTAGPRSTSLRAGSRLPPDFLSGSVASLNLVQLFFKKAAYVPLLGAACRKSGVRSG